MPVDLNWYWETFLENAVGSIGIAVIIAMVAYLTHIVKHRLLQAHTHQITFHYAYFTFDMDQLRKRLVLSTLLHSADWADLLSAFDIKVLSKYEDMAAGGSIVRMIRGNHEAAVVSCLANAFWAVASGPGHLARAGGLRTRSWPAMVAILKSPVGVVATHKHRVLAASVADLQSLPSDDELGKSAGLTDAEVKIWMTALRGMAVVMKEEGIERPFSARISEIVVRA